MKKIISVILALASCLCILAGCNNENTAESKKLSVVTTIFPEYDWIMNVLGDKKDSAEVTMLLDNGVDLHSYQPTATDIIKISSCDIFVYVGGESDSWAEDALKEATNKDMIVLDLMEILGDNAKEEEIVEGMEAEDEEGEEGEEEIEYDEHVWLSVRNAELFVSRISEAMQKADSANADSYKANSDAYIEKLNALDSDFKEAVEAGAKDTVIFGDRFPFRYLTDDYGIKYYAAFVGCSAESEASFETITFLANKVDELGLSNVIALEGTSHKIAETVINATNGKNQTVITMDSMQSTTSADVEAGETYISIMQKNLDALKEALK